MEAVGAILLKDSPAYKFDGLKRKIFGGGPQHVNVLRGELVVGVEGSDHYNYVLSHEENTGLFCDENDVAPLNNEEFLLLEAIKKPCDRMEAFSDSKLDWAAKLKAGVSVDVRIGGANISHPQYARAVVHFKGLLKEQNGLYFGVEILDMRYREKGTTDGTFRGHRYFQCADHSGLFVPLDLIRPTVQHPRGAMAPTECSDQGKRGYKNGGKSSPGTSARDGTSYSTAVKGTSSLSEKSPGLVSSVDPVPSAFKMNQRVEFFDKRGTKHYGVVRWIGRKARDKTFDYTVVGIECEKQVFISDVENSIVGMSHLASTIPIRRAVFLPEFLVDNAGKSASVALSKQSKDSNKHSDREQAEKARGSAENDSNTIEVMVAAEESISAIPKQKEAMRKFEAEKRRREAEQARAERRRLAEAEKRVAEESSQKVHNVTPAPNQGNQQLEMEQYREQGQSFGGDKHGRHGHTYDEVYGGQDQAVNSDKHGRSDPMYAEVKGTSPVSQHRDMQQQPHHNPMQEKYSDYNNQPSHGDWEKKPHDVLTDVGAATARANLGVVNPGPQIFASADTPSNLLYSLDVGSLIQLPSSNPNNPPRYGTIRWMGTPHGVEGIIAGVELDEDMDGCGDGTYPQTGQKYFNCPYGKGLYYPLKSLQPDERYAAEVATDGNPLRQVSEEEEAGQSMLAVENYIGEERGIQGHQNSCYLDATLFGLFALSNEFDSMFLRNSESATPSTTAFTIGTILWKNIVNPLRKNGVVKFECVMKLREQLDQLGKMKGITQDEKDPEEFLNMMFKHMLQVQPFITIRRPFGVEKEYFVQLFLEMDDAQKLPSIGDLVEKMFKEQNISFTEVPSKLLIQVPRFGKKFQTFRKIIPAKSMNVARNVDLTHPLQCFNCETTATKICPQCATSYGDGQAPPPFCNSCLEIVHKHRSRKGHKWEWCQEMQDVMAMADLELLSVICIETSHYVCFTRQDNRWIFFDSMANRVYDKYNIPRVVECTAILNEWVYPAHGNLSRLLSTTPRELPELVRRFTQDIYMCVYIQPDMSMYS